jgi:hypothetical protein
MLGSYRIFFEEGKKRLQNPLFKSSVDCSLQYYTGGRCILDCGLAVLSSAVSC